MTRLISNSIFLLIDTDILAKVKKGVRTVKLFSEFNKVFQIDNISISERLNTAEASFTTKLQILPSIEAIRSLCNLIPDRDNFCLTFKNDSDDIVYVTNQSFASLDFSILTENLSPEDDIDIKIQIDKKVSDGKFSIYDFSSFSKDLSKRPILVNSTPFVRQYDIMFNRWGDFNAKGSTKQTIHAGIQEAGRGNHDERKDELQRNGSTI
jgi:hypothetical protein